MRYNMADANESGMRWNKKKSAHPKELTNHMSVLFPICFCIRLAGRLDCRMSIQEYARVAVFFFFGVGKKRQFFFL